jgi:hypothetical protein
MSLSFSYLIVVLWISDKSYYHDVFSDDLKLQFFYNIRILLVYNIYDYNSYIDAVSNGRGEPRLIGTLEISDKGEKIFKTLVI